MIDTEEIKFIRLDSSYSRRLAEIEAECFSHPWTEETINGELSFDNSANGISKFYIAAINRNTGELLGYAGFTQIIDETEIMRVAVRPSARRRGLAEKMLRMLETEWPDCGVSLSRLEVRENNTPAIGLYTKVGYKPKFIRRDYYGQGVNAIIMEKKIDGSKRSVLSD